MRGKSNNIDVASLLFMVLIIIIIVSFLVNPVNIAGAGNWSEEKMGINRVLNKGESKGLISECDNPLPKAPTIPLIETTQF